jgi:hypothetical protein
MESIARRSGRLRTASFDDTAETLETAYYMAS